MQVKKHSQVKSKNNIQNNHFQPSIQISFIKEILQKDGRIRKGVINPKDPKENGTIGGTGPLNIDAACKEQ